MLKGIIKFTIQVLGLVILLTACQDITSSEEDADDSTSQTETVEEIDFMLQSHPYAATVDTDPEFRIEINGEEDNTFQITGIESGRNDYSIDNVSTSGISADDEVKIVPDEPVGNYDIKADIGDESYSGVTGRDSDGSLSHEFMFVYKNEPKGDLEVNVTTKGSPSHSDDYDIEFDGVLKDNIGQNATKTLNDIGKGIHHVEIAAIPDNCSFTYHFHKSVEVIANQVESLSFELNCGTDSGQSFNKNTITTSANSVREVILADINHDNRLDVIAGSDKDGNHKVRYYLNSGDSSASFGVITNGDNGARQVTSGDLNNDSYIDIVGASGSAAHFSWYENDSNANFPNIHSVSSSFFGRSQEALIADINQDDKPDLISSDWGGVDWFENEGNGNFSDGKTVGSLDDADVVAAGDVNDNGRPDLIGGAADNGRIVIFENTNNGFNEVELTDDSKRISEIITSDIDRDGDIDILTAQRNNTVAWHENQGGSFSSKKTINTGNNGGSWIDVGDVNNDDYVDIVAVSFENNIVLWYPNNSNGGFDDPQIISDEVSDPSSISTGDIDGVGNIDLVVGANGSGEIIWFQNN